MQKKYIVRLTEEERETLNRLVKKRRVSSQKVRRAHVLLKADADGPNWTDAEIAAAFGYRGHSTLFTVDQRFIQSNDVNNPLDRFQYGYDRNSNRLYRENLTEEMGTFLGRSFPVGACG